MTKLENDFKLKMEEFRIKEEKMLKAIDVAILIISGSESIPTDTIRTFNNLINNNIKNNIDF